MSRARAAPPPSPPTAVREASPRWGTARQPAVLLDMNTLVALGWVEHEAHAAVVQRLDAAAAWATCAITQLGFVRISSTSGIFSRTLSPPQAHAALQALCADAEHAYLAEHPAVTACDFGRLTGPRQTTDAYLLALAQHHGMRLLTLDKRLAQAFAGGPFELLEVG
ncbi:ribonuclease VapC39 [Pseudorhodoferax aquiterrae]|uniref:Ribonuclease VapC n=1 Tax=Pseudorhodoferax aquiterrae TaxID=747304 RepID=A0ABQ3FW54_9BURK|nr:ribonuclease VapC39 [Pseudorhodoferax aquiterrae]